MKKEERTMNKNFGAYLKGLRENAGMSLFQVEEKTGISSSYLNRIERNTRRAVSLPILEKLAKCFNRPALEIVKVALNDCSDDLDAIPIFPTIIYSHNFLIADMEASKDCKEAIVDTVNCIVTAMWSNESKIKDTLSIVSCVERLKKVMGHV